MPESLAAGTDQHILFFFFFSPGKNAVTYPHIFAGNSAFSQIATFAAWYFNMMLITFYKLYSAYFS